MAGVDLCRILTMRICFDREDRSGPCAPHVLLDKLKERSSPAAMVALEMLLLWAAWAAVVAAAQVVAAAVVAAIRLCGVWGAPWEWEEACRGVECQGKQGQEVRWQSSC